VPFYRPIQGFFGMTAKRLRSGLAVEPSSRELLLYQRAAKPTPFGFPYIELCLDYTNIDCYRQHQVYSDRRILNQIYRVVGNSVIDSVIDIDSSLLSVILKS